jgi:predicted unusual protein kinase regulating ubiquinone biosynthesis (AarF/ABC1/UbiB family)
LDLGMVGRIAPGLQESLLKLLLAISEGRGEEVASLALRIGRPNEAFDEQEFRRRISALAVRYHGATLHEIQVGRVVLEIARASGDSGVLLPHELTLLGKALLNLDQVSRTLDPDLDPNAAIQANAAQLMRQRMWKSASPGNLFSAAMEAKEFVEMLPGRVNRILERIADNDLAVRVDSIDEHRLMEGFQKVANRITMGLLLAALIVGAAMLMRVETQFRIFGYPGLAMLLFLVAAGGGIALLVAIVFTDERPRRRPRPHPR